MFDGVPQAMGQDDIDRIYNMPQPAVDRKDAASTPTALVMPSMAGTQG